MLAMKGGRCFRCVEGASCLWFRNSLGLILNVCYLENKDTNLSQTYSSLAEEFGMDGAMFVREFESPASGLEVKQDFKTASEAAVRGFPTLVLVKNSAAHLVSNGYSPALAVIPNIEQLLAESNT